MSPEELVGQEEDVAARIDRLHDLDGVGRGAADVGERLDLGCRVDVGDDDGIREVCFPLAQLLGSDRVGERATRTLVRDQDRLLRAEDLGGLGHEVHAAEHDGVLGYLGGHTRERERITDVIGNVLNRRQLVVVRQQGRTSQIGEPSHFRGPFSRRVDSPVTTGSIDDVADSGECRVQEVHLGSAAGHDGSPSPIIRSSVTEFPPREFSTYDRKHDSS